MDFDIDEMLLLRAQGWSTIALGRKYNKDHTTILYHCKKHGVMVLVYKRHTKESAEEEQEEYFPPMQPVAPKVIKYAYILEERRNPGKSYKEYVAEQKRRAQEKAA